MREDERQILEEIVFVWFYVGSPFDFCGGIIVSAKYFLADFLGDAEPVLCDDRTIIGLPRGALDLHFFESGHDSPASNIFAGGVKEREKSASLVCQIGFD